MNDIERDEETINISVDTDSDVITYLVLDVVRKELQKIEDLFAIGDTAEARKALSIFLSEIKEKQQSLLDEIHPF